MRRLTAFFILIATLTLVGCDLGFTINESGRFVHYSCADTITRTKYLSIQACRVEDRCRPSSADFEFELNYKNFCSK